MDQARIKSFKDLIVWQKAFELCLQLYRVTRLLPAEERFGLSLELRKTSRSVVCNIAEGHRRRSTAEYARFLDIASGSAAELFETATPGWSGTAIAPAARAPRGALWGARSLSGRPSPTACPTWSAVS